MKPTIISDDNANVTFVSPHRTKPDAIVIQQGPARIFLDADEVHRLWSVLDVAMRVRA